MKQRFWRIRIEVPANEVCKRSRGMLLGVVAADIESAIAASLAAYPGSTIYAANHQGVVDLLGSGVVVMADNVVGSESGL